MKQIIFALGSLVLLTGCAAPKIYSWGSYEPMVYTMYATPDNATADIQVIKLEEDIQKARSKNQKLPPGFYAHLGYLYFQQGKPELAKRAFETEKAAFPESAVLMDRMISKL
jgi:hypothetical protein